MLSSKIKNDINDCNNVSKHQLIDEKNAILSTESLTQKSMKNEETWGSNENVNVEPSILFHCIDIKEEDVKVEPEFDIFSEEQDSNIDHSPSGKVEFVEIQDVKIEEVDDYYKEEDPIKVNEGTFICNYCRRAFTSAEYRQRHIARCRVRIANHPSTSATAMQYKKPRLTNDEEKLHQCDKCGNKFKSQGGLYQHVRRHSGIGLHICTVCHRQCIKPSELARHMLIHTGEKPHKCTQCGAAFNTAGYLKRHMLIHTGAKPHKCTQCDLSFILSIDLTRHMRTHTGEKPYQCTQCSKAFIKSGDLRTHMRTHTGEKPYQCTVCNQAFVQSCNLRRHMKIHSKKTNKKP